MTPVEMRHAVLNSVFGDSWKTFIGGSPQELEGTTDDLLDDLNWEFSRYWESPTATERTMYGAKEKIRYEIGDGEFSVSFTSVSFDPLLRAFGPLMVSEEKLREYRNSASIINVKPIADEERVSQFLRGLDDRMDRDPWEISHPRFAFSPLLRAKVRVYWTYWLDGPDDEDSRR